MVTGSPGKTCERSAGAIAYRGATIMRTSLHSLVRQLLPLLIGVAVAQCDSPSEVVCTDEFRFGLTVTVVDSVTSSPPASAILIARSGTFVDSVGPSVPLQIHVND